MTIRFKPGLYRIQRGPEADFLAIDAVVECKSGGAAIGTGGTLVDDVAVRGGSGGAADVGGESIVQSDWVRFAEVGGRTGLAAGVGPQTDGALS